MGDNTIWILLVGVVVFGGGWFLMNKGKKTGGNHDDVVAPLKIQAYERLLLYLERMRFSVLVKRVFMPGMSCSDLQFALIQNIQDEFEHNLAQRLYVEEQTWIIVSLAKEEALRTINKAFGENPEANAATMAQTIASMSNPLIDKAIITIKKEFNTL
jgi:hypothetical protein